MNIRYLFSSDGVPKYLIRIYLYLKYLYKIYKYLKKNN